MRYTALAWIAFITGLLVLHSCDYYVRWRDGWLCKGGLPTPDVVWFGIPMLLGVIAVALWWSGTAGFERWWVRVVVVALQTLACFAVYLAACVWYVVETGVDSL
jgi:hypothetical protein